MHALLSYVAASDVRIASRVRGWVPPRWFCVAMLMATRFGDGWGWAALALLLATDREHGRVALLVGRVAGALSIGVFTVLKRAFKRPRPCAGESRTLFDLRPPDRFSLPSGHAMAARRDHAMVPRRSRDRHPRARRSNHEFPELAVRPADPRAGRDGQRA